MITMEDKCFLCDRKQKTNEPYIIYELEDCHISFCCKEHEKIYKKWSKIFNKKLEEITKNHKENNSYLQALSDFEDKLSNMSFSEDKEQNILIKREILLTKLKLIENRKVFKLGEVK